MSIERVKIESQQELEQMITKEIGQIEEDLNMICNHVPINDKTTLDVLCHDNNGQLVVLQISVSEDDIMLLQGIQSIDYVNKFKSFLKATYSKHKIDDQEQPRLVLIAPSFSDAVRHAVEGMKGMRIDLYEWEYLKLGDHKGLRLQPIFAWNPHEKPYDESKPTSKKNESKSEPKSSKKKEQSSPEKKEEPLPDLKPESPAPEPAHDEFPVWPSPSEESPTEEKDSFKPSDEEPPKKRLKLF